MLPYQNEDRQRRVLMVVRELVEWNREMTPAEDAEDSREPELKASLNASDSFQRRNGNTAFWILDSPVNSMIDDARPIGVVYAHYDARHTTGENGFAADIIWHPVREQYLLVLSMSWSDNFSAAVFPLDLDRRLEIQAPTLVGRKQFADCPKPLTPIAELRTELSPYLCAATTLKAIPDQKSLLIGVAHSSPSCRPFLFRYEFRERRWSRLDIADAGSPNKTRFDAGRELHGQRLEPPAEEGDPGGSRRTKPFKLKPIADPQSSGKVSPTPTPQK